MADFRKLSNAQLVDFLRQAEAAMGLGAVSGFTGDQNTAFEGSLGDAATALETAITEQVAARAASLSAAETTKLARVDAISALALTKLTMRAANASDAEIEAVGFDPYDRSRTNVNPQIPEELSVIGSSNGNNTLTWKRAGNPYGITFQIAAKVGDGAEHIVGITKSTKFVHSEQVPGVKVTYRVRAVAAKTESTYSNPAVVYG